MGGSTNMYLHILAIAREADVAFTIEDMQRIGERVPLIANLQPYGAYRRRSRRVWLFRGAKDEEKRFASLLAITLPVLLLFFASREWHGGLSDSLRYFLALVPLFPVAAIISARRLPGSFVWGWAGAIGGAMVIAAVLIWTDNVFGMRVILEQRLPPVVFLALAAATAIAIIGPQNMRSFRW